MRRSFAVAFLAVLSVFPASVLAQQGAQSVTQTPAAPTPPARDPQAVQALHQSFMAMGSALPADTVAVGTVSIVAGSLTETGTIRILTRGADQTVEELDTDQGHRKLVYSRLMASETQGVTTSKLNGQLAATSQASVFPLPILIGGLNQPDMSLQYIGLETLAGVSLHHIRITNSFASRKGLQPLAKFTAKDLWIDAASGLPRKLSYVRRAADGPSIPGVLMEVEFSDYRQVGSVMYPFQIKKSMNGSVWTTISIQNVNLNTGLSDTDFKIQ